MTENFVILKNKQKAQVADFIRMALFREFVRFKDMVDEFNCTYDDEDTTYFMKDTHTLLSLLHRINITGTSEGIVPNNFDDTDIKVSYDEAVSYSSLVEMSLCDIIREDEEIDNPIWLVHILNFYQACEDMLEQIRAETQASIEVHTNKE